MLKDILRKLEGDDAPSKDDIDGEFFQALEDELEKVNNAFVGHVAAIESIELRRDFLRLSLTTLTAASCPLIE